MILHLSCHNDLIKLSNYSHQVLTSNFDAKPFKLPSTALSYKLHYEDPLLSELSIHLIKCRREITSSPKVVLFSE